MLILALIFISVFSEEEKVDTGPKKPTVEQMMNEASGLAEAGQFEEALAKYNSIEQEYPDNYEAHLGARKAIDDLKERIERNKQLAEANKKWEAFEKWESANMGDLAEVKSRLESIIENEPLLSEKASAKLSAINDALEKAAKSVQQKKFSSAKAKGEAAVITLKLDDAMDELIAFRKEYPNSEYDEEIQDVLDRLNSAVEKRYTATRKTAEEYIGRKRYSQAISAYEEFKNDVDASSFEEKADRAVAAINRDLEEYNDNLKDKVQKSVAAFNFDSAIQELTNAELIFAGTGYSEKIPRQKKAVSLLKAYHSYIISEINKTGRNATDITIASYMDGKRKLVIAGASANGISIPLTGAATTVITWDKIKPEEMYQIYSLYTPAGEKNWQAALKIYKALFAI